ncbi:MAG: helix-turn-helix domain-containing protein, partial [Defluviitaleaceae bacterium]|nr:helix-turn-helix domain-containing protein [Defluviitaleaceae bacterium]
MYKIEREFSEFGQKHKILETQRIAIPIVERLTYTAKEKWEFYDIMIAQITCFFAQTFEEANELTEKAFIVLKRFEKEKHIDRIKLGFHLNNVYRLLRAKFFEIDIKNEKERHDNLKILFDYNLEEGLKILKTLEEEKFKIPELIFNIRAAIMEKNSNKIIRYMRLLKSIEKHSKIYSIMRDEVAEYSFHPDFHEIVEEHFNIMRGSNIRKMRTKLGIKLTEMENLLDFNENYFSMIERGERPISDYNLSKVARFFNVTLDELCYGKR